MRRPWAPWALVLAIVVVLFGTIGGWAYARAHLSMAGVAETCITVGGPGGVYVNLDDETNRETISHERDAVRNGSARILHWDPADAVAHRAASLRGVPTRPGFDRDEYPPAATQEGGAGADVRYISPADNRSAGSRMGAQMRAFCPGQAFILEP